MRREPSYFKSDEFPELLMKNKQDYSSYFENYNDDGLFLPENRKNYIEQGIDFVVSIYENKVDTLVILDISSRPLALFIKSLWKRVYPGIKPPEIRFIAGKSHRKLKTEEMSERVRRTKITYDLSKDVFDGKVVLVVDELISTGNTLKNAQEQLTSAFPNIGKVILGYINSDMASEISRSKEVLHPYVRRSSIKPEPLGLGFVLQYHPKKDVVEKYDNAIVARKNIEHNGEVDTLIHILNKIGQYEELDDNAMSDLDKYEDSTLSSISNNSEGELLKQKLKAHFDEVRRAFLSLKSKT
ncbi:MAG: phosphoribosyltransferase [Candidatus Magasanikbacteria bacterium]|jgi:hypothetical protein